MTRRTLLALPLSILTGMPARVRLNPSMRLSFGGLGPLRIGMTETQVRTVLADSLKSDQPESAEGCKYLDVEGAGLDLMMQNSRLVRIDVNDRRWLSVSGARIGSTGDDIRRLYGPTIRSEENHDSGGNNLIVLPRDPNYRGLEMLFEVVENVVQNFRAGTVAAVTLTEGCS